MKNEVRIIDHTINEALRLGMGIDNIDEIISNLKKYYVNDIDVSLSYWKKNNINLDNGDHMNLIRCIVSTSMDEISEAKQLGFSKIVITWTHKPKKLFLLELSSALAEVKTFTKEIYLCVENLSDFSPAEMRCYWPIIAKYEVKRFIYKDKDSIMDPFKIFKDINLLQQEANCPIEFLGINSYGLATANSLAAYKAGVRYIGSSIGGVGFPGHAATEEVLMALKHLWKQEQVPDGFSLAFDCAEILSYIGIKLPVDKAIIGKYVFAHESGIHVDGISKNPSLYEVIKPEEVGLTRKLIIGKHSGTASIKFKFLQWNLNLNQSEAIQMLEKVKEIAVEQKSALSDCQLQQLYKKQGIANGC